MPTPENPQPGTDPKDEGREDQITLRTPHGLKGRAVRAARKQNRKLSPWLIEAIEEKCAREGE